MEKISDVLWKIEKKGKMNVPVLVVASKKLLEKMKKDETITQIKNVATLPNIYDHAVLMPDGHEGYGFPIGGVAAFDLESGVVSPGGIGYDINCLSPNTKVLMDDGYWVKIKDVKGGLIKSYEIGKHNSPTEFLFLARKPAEKVYEILTEGGRKIEGSQTHPTLTPQGFIELGNLSVGDYVIIYPFEGVKFERDNRTILEDIVADEQVRKYLKERELLPFSYSNKFSGVIARILGYAFGDGHLNLNGRPRISFYGEIDELKSLKRFLKRIGVNSNIYSRKRKVNIKTPWNEYEVDSNSNVLTVTSRSFALFLSALGMPDGNKIEKEYHVPNWILNGPNWIRRNFIAGFFGADGSSPIILNYTPLPINLTQSKSSKIESNLVEFLKEISDMLKSFGINSSLYKIKSLENKVTYRLYVEGEENIRRFLGVIGYEISEKKKETGLWVLEYLNMKKREVNRRKIIRKKVREMYSKGAKISEIESEFNINRRFIERSIYEDVENVRIGKDFIKFDEFKRKYCLPGGFVIDKINKIEIRNPDFDFFYDLGVDRIHNFIANGIVVHNCGVRTIRTNLEVNEVKKKLPNLLDVLFKNVPSGVGRGGRVKLNRQQLNEVLDFGVKWAVENGFGWEKDLKHIEEDGQFKGADQTKVSDKAKSRGQPELGSLGAGNHFLEIQKVEEVYNEKVAEKFGLFKNQVVIMVHTGSRGLGHQVCTDYIMKFKEMFPEAYNNLVDKELVYAPLDSKFAQDYLSAMKAAANYAWTNREMITHWIRESFEEVFKRDAENLGMELVYDVAHNIAKIEKYNNKKLIVHRKGATRAFGPGRKEIPQDYRDVGQPVLIPGSMGTASYILVGSKEAEKLTFGSTAHGAGREMSRHAARRNWSGEEIKKMLNSEGILIRSTSMRVVAEEAPEAYKDINEVVRVSHEAGIGKLVVKLKPLGVVKG